MEFLDLAKARYSVRSFRPDAVPAELVEQILTAARVAPTACNNQPQKVLVLESAESLALWRKCTKCHFNEQLVMIVCYDKTQSWKREYDGQDSGYVDASIVTTHMMLKAAELGIGSTWIMYFIPEAVRTEFNMPENLEPVSVLAMGYPSQSAAPSPRHSLRKPLTDTVVYDHF